MEFFSLFVLGFWIGSIFMATLLLVCYCCNCGYICGCRDHPNVRDPAAKAENGTVPNANSRQVAPPSLTVNAAVDSANEMLADLHSLLADPCSSDVTFVCGDKRLPAHKYLLCLRSEVFKAMFRHDLSEAASNEIVVDDIQPKVMEKMINFIAGKNIEFCDATEAGEMLMAAHKYDIKGLFKFCAKELMNKLDANNCVNILVRASLLKLAVLEEAALCIVVKNNARVKLDPDFQLLRANNPQLALDVLEKVTDSFARKKARSRVKIQNAAPTTTKT